MVSPMTQNKLGKPYLKKSIELMVRPRTVNEKKARIWSREPYFQSLDKTKDV